MAQFHHGNMNFVRIFLSQTKRERERERDKTLKKERLSIFPPTSCDEIKCEKKKDRERRKSEDEGQRGERGWNK